jgi:hypothetical protein
MKCGDPKCMTQIKSNSYKIKSLQSFSFKLVGVEKGIGIKEKAKQICELIDNPETLEEERNKTKAIRAKLSGMPSASCTVSSFK